MFCHGVMRKFIKSTDGQALVEASLTTPFLAMVLLGAVEVARVAYASIQVANAAKAAVQYGAQSTATASDLTGIKNAAMNDASGVSGLTTTVSSSGICSNGNSCTGTGGSCLPTDCSGAHIEQILTVDTSATITPSVYLPGNHSFQLHGHATQKVLNY